MSDIALELISDGETGPKFDFVLESGDLKIDGGLKTPVVLSLFCDRLAASDDVIPDGTADRRGWWGDISLDGSKTADADLIGSRLWLLDRDTVSAKTATLARRYGSEALAWLVIGGVVGGVDVVATWTETLHLSLSVGVSKNSSAHSADKKYEFLWSGTLG
jgi:phage gp46-like protein